MIDALRPVDLIHEIFSFLAKVSSCVLLTCQAIVLEVFEMKIGELELRKDDLQLPQHHLQYVKLFFLYRSDFQKTTAYHKADSLEICGPMRQSFCSKKLLLLQRVLMSCFYLFLQRPIVDFVWFELVVGPVLNAPVAQSVSALYL